jgi:hypothetical protein
MKSKKKMAIRLMVYPYNYYKLFFGLVQAFIPKLIHEGLCSSYSLEIDLVDGWSPEYL